MSETNSSLISNGVLIASRASSETRTGEASESPPTTICMMALSLNTVASDMDDFPRAVAPRRPGTAASDCGEAATENLVSGPEC